MSLGLSFDSKPTKVPKKVIILPRYKLNKIMRFKKCQRVQKAKGSRYTGSVLRLSGSWRGGAQAQNHGIRGAPPTPSGHLVLERGHQPVKADSHLWRLQR